MAVQPGPTPALVIAQAQLLFAILMEALDRPAPMGEPRLGRERGVVQPPGEIPLPLATRIRQWTLADQPPHRPGDIVVRAMHAQAADLALAARPGRV